MLSQERAAVSIDWRRFLRRTPGRSSGVPMNSMPADSIVIFNVPSIRTCPEGTPSAHSNRRTVATPRPAFLAKSSADHLNSARAVRIRLL